MTTFQVADDVYGIDFELFDSDVGSVYLFDDEEPTLIDTGTAASAETIKKGLTDCGVPPSQLKNIVLSHIHVEHSGAASALVDAAPEANVYIHESTAPHLIDPSKLIKSSKEAMGEYFDPMGEQGRVPNSNVVCVSDSGTTIDSGKFTIELIHTPGHSPDHLAVWSQRHRLLYAAECLGVYLSRADRWLPPATLPNFDVEMIDDAIDTLRVLDPDQILFPHFGVWPYESDEAFVTAKEELHRFDERIIEICKKVNSIEDTKDAVAAELVAVSPPYVPIVEEYNASIITEGYLHYHGLR